MRPLPVTTKIGIDTSGNGVEAEMSKMSTAPVDIWHIQMFYYAYRIPNYVYKLHIHHIWWYTKLRLYLRYIYIHPSNHQKMVGHRPYLHCLDQRVVELVKFSQVSRPGTSLEARESTGLMATWDVHPGRLIWNLQITHLERKMIFQTSMIMFHVNLPGCKEKPVVNHEISTRWW